MSLINKMLQDLEERRSEGEVVGSLQGQLRAAPQPRRMHAAGWVALALAIMLTAGVSWLWGRQSAPVVVMAPASAAASMPLKMASELQAARPEITLNNQPIAAAAQTTSAMPVELSSELRKIEQKSLAADTTHDPSPAVQGQSEASRGSKSVPTSPALVLTASPASPTNPVASPEPRPAMSRAPAEKKPLPESKLALAPVNSAAPPSATEAQVTASASRDAAAATGNPVQLTKQIKELTPQQRAENEYRRATNLIQQGKMGEATSALEQALQFDPQHSLALQTLVGVLLENKRSDEAIRRLQDGLAADRTQPALAMMLARLQVDKNYLKPAIDTLQRTLPYATERADYVAFLAALFQRDARHKEAIENYLVALRQSPQNGIWWMGLGISLQSEGRLQEARDAYRQANSTNTLPPELSAFVDQKLNQIR